MVVSSVDAQLGATGMGSKPMSRVRARGESTHPIVFGQPQILEDEIAEVVACLRSGWIGTGPRVARFERDFAAFKGVSGAAAVASCSAALHLSVIASGIRPGDEVITSPLTFCSTVNAIIHAGGQPVLAEIDPATGNLNPVDLEARITGCTRAVIPVHFAGRPCDMESICRIADRHELQVIEDCAHAVETKYRGRPAGTIGNFGCFSFYATKNLTTGEGGMVLARGQRDLGQVKTLASHGLTRDAWERFQDPVYTHYYATEVGSKYNMTDLQAAIGIHQLRRLEANWQRRHKIWSRYLEGLAKAPITLPSPPESDTRHAYHLFTVLIDAREAGISRDDFLAGMARRGIGTGVHFLSIPEHPVYQSRFGWRPEHWPAAQRVGQCTVSLPLNPGLTDADVERVIDAVHKVLRL